MTGIYNIRPKTISSWQPIGLVSKVAALLLPIVAVCVPRAPGMRKALIPSLVVSCAPSMSCLEPSHQELRTDTRTVLFGFVLGSVCILFIVAKYVRTKQMFDSQHPSRSGALSVDTPQTPNDKRGMSQKLQFRVDRWLLLRFIICFVILR